MRRSWFFLFYAFIFPIVFAQAPAPELPNDNAPAASESPATIPENSAEVAAKNTAETLSKKTTDMVADNTAVLRGEVFYLPRIALPQGAELVLTINNFSIPTELLQQQRLPLHGKQVPIAFIWPIALTARLPTIAILQAAIINTNKIIWMSGTKTVVLMPGQQDLGEMKLTAANLPPLTLELYCGQKKFHLKEEAGQQLLAISTSPQTALNFVPLTPLPSAQGRRFLLPDTVNKPLVLAEDKGEFFLQSASGRTPCLDAAQLPALTFVNGDTKMEIFEGDFLLTIDKAQNNGQALYLSPIYSVQPIVANGKKTKGLFFHSELFDLWYYPESCAKAKSGSRITLRMTNRDLAEKIGSEKTFCAEAAKPHNAPAQ